MSILAALPVSLPVIVIAILVLALVMGIGGALLLRGKKKETTDMPGSSADWQRQAAQNAWSQQSSSAGWGQQQQPQQQASWGQPQQQQPAWGQPDAWGQQPQQPAWGQPQQPQPQQTAWGQQPAWGQPQQSQPNARPTVTGPWGDQAAQPSSWEQPKGASPQEAWGQPQQPQPQQPAWGQQQPQTAYGNQSANQGGWGQQQTADPWAAPAVAPASESASPTWQQGGVAPNAPAARPDPNAAFAGADSDRTMLRSSGQQGALGMVRVEEGKEPGRIYEVRKDSLSIGRSRDSDIFLEDLAVSRLHASILNMGNGNYALKDEGSANGTKVNGQLLNKYQTYPLQEGDRVQLGQTVLVFARR